MVDERDAEREWKDYYRKHALKAFPPEPPIDLTEKPSEAQDRHVCKMNRAIFGTKCDHNPICGA